MRRLGAGFKPGTPGAASFYAIFTLGLHLICALVTAVPAVLAPVAAPAFGMHPGGVGALIAVMFIVSLPAGLTTAGIVARVGAARACHLVAAGSAIALLLMAAAAYGALWASSGGSVAPQAFVLLLLLSAAVLGFPIGMINPLSSQILFRAAPPRLRSFFFSVKQTAVPGAYVTAGLLVPALLLVMSWQAALLVMGVALCGWLLFTMTVHVEVASPAPDARHPAGGLRAFVDPVVAVWRSPPLREMGLVSLLYSMNQTVMSAYLVSHLNLGVGLSLVAAGAIYAAGQFAGMAGRIVWGLSADLWVKPRTQIGLLGVVGGLCALIVATFSAQWSQAAMLAVCVLFGFSAVSWNGIFLAEVARLAALRDPGEIGAMTAGTGFFNNLGALCGPGLASVLVVTTNGYSTGFVVFAIPPLLLGAKLLLTRFR
ncbi:MAG: MFS transporter [Betaproteobacteria bacterium]|nr:MFS transporter [Betaproteobacteria bacterium]